MRADAASAHRTGIDEKRLHVNKDAMLLASACVAPFVVLDLPITWSNYAALVTLDFDDHLHGIEIVTVDQLLRIADRVYGEPN